MSNESVSATTAGHAFRVTLTCVTPPEAYRDVYVRLDEHARLVHIFAGDARTHYLTVPLGSVLVEWRDPAELKPQPRTPPYGPRNFEELGDQLRQMTESLGSAL